MKIGTMTRLTTIGYDDLTIEQQRLLGELPSGKSQELRGPHSVLVRVPDLIGPMADLGIRVRWKSRLELRHFELMALVVAQFWTSQYEWFAHEPLARKAGLLESTIEDIKNGRRPTFDDRYDAIVYDVVHELQTNRQLSDATFRAAEAAFGEAVLIELVTAAGYYSMIASILNAFEVPIPAGVPLPFAPSP
jgi:4-carboxymuconolactone decarboxylase